MVDLGLFLSANTVKSVTVTFRIPYHTQWGQSLVVCGSVPLLGSWNVKRGLLLTPLHQGNELIWRGSIEVPSGFECEYIYHVVDDEKNTLRWEMGNKRKLMLPDTVQDGEEVELHDLWQTGSDALPFRSAFKDVIFRNSSSLRLERPLGELQHKLGVDDSVLLHFKICCPNLEKGASVYVIGSPQKLGQWKVDGALKLSYAGDSIWQADCVMEKNDFPIKYPFEVFRRCLYGKYDKAGKFSIEIGSNRELSLDILSNKARYMFLSDGIMREMPWRGAGMAIPMFSVRSEDDLGVGEFLDLKLLVDWAVASGFHLVQLLPINDTSVHGMWWDSYPYSSLSVFALHPLYLRVQSISDSIPEGIQKEISEAKERLNLKDVDYEATMATKLSIAKKIFSKEKDQILQSSSFKKFFSDNELEKLISEEAPHYTIICFHYYIQYHLHLQLSEVAEYAREKGVVLKGDLPIGVDRNSVDTWVYPTLFRMNTSTGAPPDYFDKNGQNWGFPTYNWEEMSKDNYAWWRARLTQMAKYFTAYRIDHILGFFRIWELPEHAVTGLVGKFRPSIPLSQEELEKEGIWDFDRLSRPYILQEYLEEQFGSSWTVVASLFLNEYQKGHYEFKGDCNTEKKIASKLKDCQEKSLLLGNEAELRLKLFDLLRNIVLIRDPEDARKFYPRFNLEDTTSFRDLDDHSKNVLRRLYYDYYFHRQENLWRQNALKTLPVLLNSSDMLACGEDLGLVPSCVHPFRIRTCGSPLPLMLFPPLPTPTFTETQNQKPSIPRPSCPPPVALSGSHRQPSRRCPCATNSPPPPKLIRKVCAPSCHDCSTLRAWWEEDEERRRRYFKTIVGSNRVPPSQCVPEIAYFIIRQHVESPSMWAIFPLQDLLALKEEYAKRPAKEETINDPTNPKHYWRYRSHVTVESLLKDADLKKTIRDLVRGSGRSYPHDDEEPTEALHQTSQVARSNGVGQRELVAAR
ncbi:hypothetical protein Cgig2_026589 [Carnegiea gigantea]|uniref:4-alpha-glucanotransferase n=1 Tax=Carnegiea gigantea TaxID=171969 RepID=A0A9Q1KK17_9CARY|nr:hypothetical protein Cgig2_026589 [Carnegiea gigantea]